MMRVKVEFEGDIRRFKYPENDKYNALTKFIKSSFHFSSNDNFMIQYFDDENDKITIESEVDFNDAIDCAKQESRKSLKLQVTPRKIKSMNDSATRNYGTNTTNEAKEATESKQDTSDWRHVALDFLQNKEINNLLPELVHNIFVAWRAQALKRGDFGVFGQTNGLDEKKDNENTESNLNDEIKDFATIVIEILSLDKFQPIANHKLIEEKVKPFLPVIAVKAELLRPLLLQLHEDAVAAWVPQLVSIGIEVLSNFDKFTFDIETDGLCNGLFTPFGGLSSFPIIAELFAFTDSNRNETRRGHGYGPHMRHFGNFGHFGHGPHHNRHHGHHPGHFRHHHKHPHHNGCGRKFDKKSNRRCNRDFRGKCGGGFGRPFVPPFGPIFGAPLGTCFVPPEMHHNEEPTGCGRGFWDPVKTQQQPVPTAPSENKEEFDPVSTGIISDEKDLNILNDFGEDKNVLCICGKNLIKTIASKAYLNNGRVICDICDKRYELDAVIYHCNDNIHPGGYDICAKCVALQLKSFENGVNEDIKENVNDITIETGSNKNNDDEDENAPISGVMGGNIKKQIENVNGVNDSFEDMELIEKERSVSESSALSEPVMIEQDNKEKQ